MAMLGELRSRRTFGGDGQHGFDIVVDLARGRLAHGEVALAYISSARPGDKRLGQVLFAHMLVVGPPVNVDYVARAMVHFLRLCAATSQHWSPAQRGGRDGDVAKWGWRGGGGGLRLESWGERDSVGVARQ